MTHRSDEEPEYRRYIHRLRSLCGQWRDDISFVRDGGTINFAVDVDVIDMYLNPTQKASYGEILGRDSQTGQLLARLMGDFIFHSNLFPTLHASNVQTILLLIPPHDQELLYHLWRFARRVEVGASAVSESTFRTLNSICEQYSSDRAGATADLPDAVNRFLKRLIDHVPQLVALFDEAEGDAAALKRFSRVDSTRLLNLFNLKREDGEYFIHRPEEVFRDEISGLTSEWEARLKPYASEQKAREATAADARVLATIQHINTTLCSPKERLILITGSRYLFKAMETADVSNLSKEESDLRDKFRTMYLRHPQWIISNRNFFRTTQRDGDSRVVQMPLGLERLLELMAPLDDASKLSERRANQDRAEGFAQVQESWNAEIKALAAAKYGSGLDKAKTVGAIQLATLISDLQHAGTWSAFTFKKTLLDNASKQMNTLFLDSSSLGLLDVLAEPSRMMPALCFDTPFEEFNKIYKRLLEKMIDHEGRVSARNSSGFGELIAQVNKGPDGKDRDPYHVNILHAAAFAARGHWRQVLTLCDNAIQIATGLIEEERVTPLKDGAKEYRRGREAAYLASIACRRSAREPLDLDTATRYLDLAEERKNVGDPPDLRFESERLALSIRRMYFKCFSEEQHLNDEERQFFCDRVNENIETLKGVIDRANAARDHAEGSSNAHDVANWVLRQCYTNLFDLALIRSDIEKVSIEGYGLQQLSSQFRGSIVQDDEFRDHHAWLVSRVVGVLFCSGESVAAVLRELEKSKDANKPTPYETKRLEMYVRLINEYATE